MRLKSRAIVALFWVSSLSALARPDKDFINAIQRGANAELTVRVVDDAKQPVGDAKVRVRFDSAFKASGEVKSLVTDTNGLARVIGRTGKSVMLHVTKNGYYASHDEINYVAMGHGASGGYWLPRNLEKTIVLRPVKNPKAVRNKVHGFKTTRRVNEWLKFDIEYGDFVSPDGMGKVGDFEVLFNWDGKLGDEYTGMSVKIRSPDEYSGGCYVDKVMCSEFKGAYEFPLPTKILQEFFYFAREERDQKTREFIKREEKKFNVTKALLVRSRCEMDPNTKRIVKCNYSQITNIRFGCDDEGIAFLVQSFFNPTPNDTNLEPK